MVSLTKKQLSIIIAVGLVIIFVIGYYIFSLNSNENYEELEEISENTNSNISQNVEKNVNENDEIVVHIAGEVNTPGIVRIKEGARIADVIEKAGGLTSKANLTNINLAYIVEDGQKITIPSNENQEIKESVSNENGEGIIQDTPQTGTSQNTISKININKASKEELQTLSGIGESTAQKIIDYRKTNGEFKQIDDLKNVSGIGDAKFNSIKDNIKVK